MQKERYELVSVFNGRDLGGYTAKDGEVTSDTFIRTDCLVEIDEQDKQALLNMGVRAVIDLRNTDEEQQIENGFKETDGVDFYAFPVFSNKETPIDQAAEGFTMGDLYVYILDHTQPVMKTIFSTMANAQPGKILYHCSAGKDRTGVVSALLLNLVGVDDATIIYDYALTDGFMEEAFALLKQHGVPGSDNSNEAHIEELLSARPDNMRKMLAYLEEKYGDAVAYLKKIGLTEAEITALKEKMIK